MKHVLNVGSEVNSLKQSLNHTCTNALPLVSYCSLVILFTLALAVHHQKRPTNLDDIYKEGAGLLEMSQLALLV